MPSEIPVRGHQGSSRDTNSVMERRRYRRAELNVPVAIRQLGSDGSPGTSMTGEVKNLSLAGVFCHVKAPSTMELGHTMICSTLIPPEERRAFPFTRIHGKCTVVRVETVPMGRRAGESQASEPLVGIAMAFASDVTALGTSG